MKRIRAAGEFLTDTGGLVSTCDDVIRTNHGSLSMDTVKLLLYFTPLVLIWVAFLRRRSRLEKQAANARDAAVRDGLIEPPSLHPIINESRCIGCRSCVAVCPEQPEHSVLGVINGKAHLINPSDCIGHGACKQVCPVDAIELVFGTETRGIDIPYVKPDFETNVPGIYICGELGGMGLIRNAIEQGRQALDSIRTALFERRTETLVVDDVEFNVPTGKKQLDVVIVGAGPAGFSASLAAMEHKLQYATVEQESLGGTVAHYPRGKVVMTAPANLPIVGKIRFTVTTKEKLLEFWQDVAARTGVKINYQERMESILRAEVGFVVKTNRASYKTQTVLLAVGRRGTPRKLSVPGEDLPKVVYRLIDPEQYRNKSVLVVGGGDSALEAATSIAAEPGSQVTLSYRAEAFNRAKAKNRARVRDAERSRQLQVLFRSNVTSIHPDRVEIEQDGNNVSLPNDTVIVCAGGILPTGMLKAVGIEVETKYGAV